jgi:hypothetical protein
MHEMTTERAQAIFQTFGANPHHWPEAERAPLLALLAGGEVPDLQAELQDAQWLDGMLDLHKIEATAAQMASGYDNIIPFTVPKQRPQRLFMTASLALAASVCGIVFGLSLAHNEISQLRRIAVLQEAQFLTSEVDQ